MALRANRLRQICLETCDAVLHRAVSLLGGQPAENPKSIIRNGGWRGGRFFPLHFSTEAQILTGPDRGQDTGLLRQLRQFTDKHPDTRLIVIDTLQKVRTAADVSCGCDYNDLSLIKSFADRHR